MIHVTEDKKKFNITYQTTIGVRGRRKNHSKPQKDMSKIHVTCVWLVSLFCIIFRKCLTMRIIFDSTKATLHIFKLLKLINLYVWCEYQRKRICIHIISFQVELQKSRLKVTVAIWLIKEIIYKIHNKTCQIQSTPK